MCAAKVLESDIPDSPEPPHDDINRFSNSLVLKPPKGTFSTYISSTVVELISGLTKTFQCQLDRSKIILGKVKIQDFCKR